MDYLIGIFIGELIMLFVMCLLIAGDRDDDFERELELRKRIDKALKLLEQFDDCLEPQDILKLRKIIGILEGDYENE